MNEGLQRSLGNVLLIAGFLIWFYGFVYSSFWYANTDPSVLENIRVWFSKITRLEILPGVTEEIIGLITALIGIFLQVNSYRDKKRSFKK